jgi:glycosyltransferase involved in cell wall biosynthesis
MELSNSPLVSVIIPTYNQGTLLARAIDSALAQTYPHKEIIVVNDGSTDDITRRTAANYVEHILYIERPNGGVAAARNTGLDAARGDLVALLDQDDVWLPGKLEKEVAVLTAHPEVGLVHSSYYLIDEQNNRTGVVQLPERAWKPLPDLLLEVQVSACTTLFRRQIVDAVGHFDPALNGSDDWDLWLRIAAAGHLFHCVGEPLAEYRVHPGMTSRDDLMMARTALAVLDKFYSCPSLPPEAIAYRDRAYFNRHAWAVSLYYGLGNLDEARREMQKAGSLYPEGIATARFVRTLVAARARAQDTVPTEQTAWEAARFVLRGARLGKRLRAQLASRAALVVALYSHGGRGALLRGLAGALLRHPGLLWDDEVWRAAWRAARSRIGRPSAPGDS